MYPLLVAFDFDGTISDSEMTILLGAQAGVETEMREITKAAMNDEIEYAESLRRRVALLEGLPESAAAAAFSEVNLRKGADMTIRRLRDAGVPVVILTGGFRRGVDAALDRAGVSVDVVMTNELEIRDGVLTGAVSGPLVEGTKDEALRSVASEFDIPIADVIAVGDGANDVPMLSVAGLAVGFRPKPSVEPHCDVIVEDMAELDDLLDREIASRSGER